MGIDDPETIDAEDVEVAQTATATTGNPAVTAGSAPSPASTSNPFHVPHVEAKLVPLVGYLFSSAVFLVAVLAQQSGMTAPMYAYGVSIGVVGMFFAGFGLVLLKHKSEIDQTMLAWFLFSWAGAGACVMTFGMTPFRVTGNGYFSAWAMVLFGVQHCGVTQDDMRKGIAGSSSVTGLGVASMVVIGAISVNLKFKNEFGIAVFALVLACLTVLLVGGILYKERTSEEPLDPVYQLYLLSAFAVMWIVMACLVTFRGPFTVTGNGYFASWVGAILCVLASLTSYQAVKAKG